MNYRLVIVLFVCLVMNLCAEQTHAQNQQPEFIESSSPLSNDDRVTSRSEAGRDVQTVITVTAESIARRRAEQSNRERIDLTSQSATDATNGNRADDLASAGFSQSDRYPYPGGNRLASNQFRTPVSNVTQAATSQVSNPDTSAVRTARRTQLCQSCCCAPQTFTGLGLGPANRVPALRAQPPINFQVPGQFGVSAQQPAFQQPTFQQPTFQQQSTFQQPAFQQQPFFNTATQPRFGFQNNNRWWNPFISGSGAYQPILRLANVNPSTYLGQGIIGQPTAYVGGQPIRNLFRYVFP